MIKDRGVLVSTIENKNNKSNLDSKLKKLSFAIKNSTELKKSTKNSLLLEINEISDLVKKGSPIIKYKRMILDVDNKTLKYKSELIKFTNNEIRILKVALSKDEDDIHLPLSGQLLSTHLSNIRGKFPDFDKYFKREKGRIIKL
jgi:hypothetical protein